LKSSTWELKPDGQVNGKSNTRRIPLQKIFPYKETSSRASELGAIFPFLPYCRIQRFPSPNHSFFKPTFPDFLNPNKLTKTTSSILEKQAQKVALKPFIKESGLRLSISSWSPPVTVEAITAPTVKPTELPIWERVLKTPPARLCFEPGKASAIIRLEMV